MTLLPRTGNGDPCPQDPEHGRMWVMPSGRQYCPSSLHRGSYLYENDGRTVVILRGADTPARDLGRFPAVAPLYPETDSQPAPSFGASMPGTAPRPSHEATVPLGRAQRSGDPAAPHGSTPAS